MNIDFGLVFNIALGVSFGIIGTVIAVLVLGFLFKEHAETKLKSPKEAWGESSRLEKALFVTPLIFLVLLFTVLAISRFFYET